MNSFFPVFIRNNHIKCLVVGAGAIAARKAKSLLKHGIKPEIIAPEAKSEMVELIIHYELFWYQKIYTPELAKNYNMIIAATSSRQVNNSIKEQLPDNVLYDDISDARNSNFIIPATIKKGDIQIAVSTSGKVPYLAHQLCLYLAENLPDFPKEKLQEITDKRNEIILQTSGDDALKKSRFDLELAPLILQLFYRG